MIDEVRLVDIQRKAVVKYSKNEGFLAESRFVVQRMETRSRVAAAACLYLLVDTKQEEYFRFLLSSLCFSLQFSFQEFD